MVGLLGHVAVRLVRTQRETTFSTTVPSKAV
jgi:hypothetical protein